MKTVITEVVFGTNAKLSGVIALAVVLSVALGCNCGKDFDLANLAKNANTGGFSNSSNDTSDGSVPSDAVVEGLIKETMREFADAVDTGDFNAIHDNASSDFQGTYTVDEMKTAFKSYTDKKKVIVPILNKIEATDAEFDSPPSIRTEKGLNILVAKGKFKTKPFQTRFDYEYVMRGGEWKLLKLIIKIA
ncbi:MAG: hypothetical protein ACKVQW_02900 [Pyrinomonadaceae bacterium]